MEKELHDFLASDLLSKYLVGETTSAETQEVDYFISKYEAAAEAYEELQSNLEIQAKFDAVDAPEGLLAKVLGQLDEKTTPKVVALHNKKSKPWYFIAASVAALFFASTSIFLFLKNEQLNDENKVIVEEIHDLINDIDNNKTKIAELSSELEKFNNPDSRKYILENDDIKTVAYIDPISKTSLIDIVSLPELPENQYYQIRAELEDRMVALGILDESQRKLKQIPYIEDALALSIAIKNRDSLATENDEEVAEISLVDQ